MRYLRLVVLMSAVAVMFAGCGKKKSAVPGMGDPADADSIAVIDTTVYGRCGDGTAMHTLELITDKGDTLICPLGTGDAEADVQGGLMAGDRLAVLTGNDAEGDIYVSKVINLTTLLGRWGSLDKNFEIQDGGIVVSNMKEPKPYLNWRILNGRLLLSADTFNIYSLGADSLYLENNYGIYAYKRLK